MPWTTLISADELAGAIDRCIVVDTRHDLLDPRAGLAAYAAGHIPSAGFLHQDEDLAGRKTGRNGRHPLPEREAFATALRATGLAPGQQLVAYDAQGGMFAVRLWWLARWLGHREVAVLDGGIDAWTRAGYPLSTQPRAPRTGSFTVGTPLVEQRGCAELLSNLSSREHLVVDARAPERYRGEIEPLDPVAGHIPGAINRPAQQNLRPDGRFKPAEVLRQELLTMLDGRAPQSTIHQCGSGVSACHNLLAMELAGLPGAALYVGSWSEWCADPARPVALGETP